jgi:hypothetical protein
MTAPSLKPDNVCRCDPLPPVEDWTCTGCGQRRRYVEKISVQRGGIVSRCGDCRYEALRTKDIVPLTLCRAFAMTTLLAGELRETNTYYLCDPCINAEIARFHDADVTDGREAR